LNLYRHTGETIWLRRARQLASQAVEYAKEFGSTDQKDSRPLSLYKGHTGIALLELDLDCPLEARMPAFERETQDNVAV
jgi:serine/threonine-protein kinase